MQRRSWILLSALFAAVAFAIVYAFLPRPVPVELAEVVRGRLAVTVQEEGKTRVVDRFTVSTPIAGIAARIVLDVGDPVSKGQAVAVIEPAPPPFLDLRRQEAAQARAAAAEAALESAREKERLAAARETYAQARLERTAKLHASGFASRDALEAADSQAAQERAALRSAQFAADVARSELEAARAELLSAAGRGMDGARERVRVRSPVDGRVLAVPQRSERAVREGEPLIEVGDPGSLEVEVDVLSSDAVRIRPGSGVVFTRWGGEGTLEGKVRRVEPAGFTKVSALGVEEQRVLVIADIISPRERWRELGDGYRLEAAFVLWEGEDVLQVPSGALFRHGEGWAVFAAEKGRAALRPVTVGRRSGRSAQILSGLAEGDSVIVHPSEEIRDGVRVRER
jgi:HlyD family secretion protein